MAALIFGSTLTLKHCPHRNDIHLGGERAWIYLSYHCPSTYPGWSWIFEPSFENNFYSAPGPGGDGISLPQKESKAKPVLIEMCWSETAKILLRHHVNMKSQVSRYARAERHNGQCP